MAKTHKNKKPGYHLVEIKKGILGQSSKLQEELDELKDAEKQKCRVMAVIELSDLLGAMQAYVEKQKLGVTIEDLMMMASVTKRAFINGYRK